MLMVIGDMEKLSRKMKTMQNTTQKFQKST